MENKKRYIRPEARGISFERLMDNEENVPGAASENGRASAKEDGFPTDEEDSGSTASGTSEATEKQFPVSLRDPDIAVRA